MSESDRGQHVIRVEPDKPAILANRIFMRLARDGILVPMGCVSPDRPNTNAIQMIEAMADEIHQDILDATLRR